MEKIFYTIQGKRSDIIIGRAWELVGDLIPAGQTVIITDSNVSGYYFDEFPDCKVLTLSPGESSKSLSTVDQIVKELLKLEVDRSYFLLGIGGGVVSDITGFVASVYMRGVRFGLVSTSLLSQVDASIGGKNGVNSSGYKNVIGCFTQPEFVICDTTILKTLPYEDFKSGLAEIVKYALIRDSKLFSLLEERASSINEGNKSLMDEILSRSVKIKIDIVEEDVREKGERRLLNFGHTIGHAIEAANGLKHGLAIARGMVFSSLISLEEGYLDKDKYNRIIALLKSLGLLDGVPGISSSYLEIVRRDKKREKNIIHFVLLNDIGSAFIKEMPLQDLVTWMENKI